jgi:hypothetical protein
MGMPKGVGGVGVERKGVVFVIKVKGLSSSVAINHVFLRQVSKYSGLWLCIIYF